MKARKRAGRNTYATMAQRHSSRDALDDIPTHPWAVRAFVEQVFTRALGHDPRAVSVWEPAANRRHMSRALAEYFGTVWESDVFDYGVGMRTFDFLSLEDALSLDKAPIGADPLRQRDSAASRGVDWIITNPPFKDLLKWFRIAERIAGSGVALFCRTQVIETIERYEEIFRRHRQHLVFFQYVERVPLVTGRIDPKASSATAYGWLVFDRTAIFWSPFGAALSIPLVFIPPSRLALIRPGDYETQPQPKAEVA